RLTWAGIRHADRLDADGGVLLPRDDRLDVGHGPPLLRVRTRAPDQTRRGAGEPVPSARASARSGPALDPGLVVKTRIHASASVAYALRSRRGPEPDPALGAVP